MSDPLVTKIQLKLTRPALERLIGDDAELETIIGHQAINTIIDRHVPKLLERIGERVKAGLDLQGGSQLNVLLHEKIRVVIATEVGNYLRCNDVAVRAMIREEVEKHLPEHVKYATQAILEKVTRKLITDTLEGG